MEGDDEEIVAAEHGAGLEQVMQLADGVPARQEDEDGSFTQPADVLDQFHHQVYVNGLVVKGPQCFDDAVGVVPVCLQELKVFFLLL